MRVTTGHPTDKSLQMTTNRYTHKHEPVPTRTMPLMKIDRGHCFQVSGPISYPGAEERQVGMLDIYPEFAARTARPRSDRSTAAYVEIDTDAGLSGLFGPIFEESALLIKTKLTPYLLGQDPLAGEKLWDLLYRLRATLVTPCPPRPPRRPQR